MTRVAIVVAALALAGCASLPDTIQNGDPRDEVAALTAFTIADLQSARDLAQSADDKIAVMCWTDLLASAERLQSVAARGSIGVATKWQIARNMRRNEREACDAIVSDARSTLFRIAGRLGVVIPGL